MPSKRSPCNAKNTQPAGRVRVSVLTRRDSLFCMRKSQFMLLIAPTPSARNLIKSIFTPSLMLLPPLRQNWLTTKNSLGSLRLTPCLFSRSLDSCHRSYVRRSLSKIINLLHPLPTNPQALWGHPEILWCFKHHKLRYCSILQNKYKNYNQLF